MLQRGIPILLIAVMIAMILPGCATEEDYENPNELTDLGFTVTHIFPPDQMREFPLTGVMIVRYSNDINPNVSADMVHLRRVNDNETLTEVPVSVRAQGPALIVIPNLPLTSLSHYELSISPQITGVDGQLPKVPADGYTVTFDTGAEMPLSNQRPTITTVMPDPASDLVFDIANFRVFFSEPVNQRTVRYGENVMFTDSNGLLVNATLFTRTSQIVIDPVEDLEPGQYTLTVTTGVKDVNGDGMASDQQFTFDVKNSYPHAELRVENCPTPGLFSSCDPVASIDDLPDHPLTGNKVNSMKIYSRLLGDNEVFLSGQLIAEQCDPGDHPGYIPMVIRKGQKLFSTSLPASLGGEVPIGLETGAVTIHTITDATGMLMQSDAITPLEGGPTAITLQMDVAITTENEITNMMMSQYILGVQLFGQAFVGEDSGKLVMQVGGVAELFIMGERVPSRMSLEMKDADQYLPIPPDEQAPSVQIVSPVNNARDVRLGDPITIMFNEPVDPITTRETVELRANNGYKPSQSLLVSGAKVLIKMREPLDADTTYRITVGAGLADMAGNVIANDQRFYFKTGAVESSNEPPFVGSTSPGNDLSPIVPGQMPIEIFFSQIMDPDTVDYGDTLFLVDLSAGQRIVPGTLVKGWYRYTFFPNEPLEAGHYYRLIISGDITNYDGIALDLDRNHEPGSFLGYDELWVDFVSSGRNGWVPLILATDPLVDRDGSGYVDNTEVEPDPVSNYFNILGPLIPQNAWANGYIASYVRGLEYDMQGKPYMDISLLQGNFMHATSTRLDVGYIINLIENLINPEKVDWKAPELDGMFEPMGRILIAFTEMSQAPTVESPTNDPQMNIAMSTYMSIDNVFYNESVVNELALEATGVLSFTADGKMLVNIDGTTAMTLNFVVPFVNWEIPLPLPVWINMRTTSLPSADWWNSL